MKSPSSTEFFLRLRHMLVVPALMTVLLWVGCENGSAQEVPDTQTETQTTRRTVRVETQLVHPQEFRDRISVIGVLSSPNDAILSAQSSGTIEKLLDLGTPVRAGATVAQLDPVLITALLEQAEAALRASEASATLAAETFYRQEALFRDSIISALEFDQVHAQHNQAQADLVRSRASVAQARKQLENTTVRAPFSGVVESHMAEEGEQVAPGMPIVRVIDTRHLKLRAGVPERYAIDIRKGTEVEVDFKAYGVEARTGLISFVGSTIDAQSRSFPIEVELDNQDGSLKPEMIADVLITREVMKDQLVLPQTAIILDETGTSAYVVDRSSGVPRAHRVTVVSGASYDGETVITDGLTAGDEVIVVGQSTVTDGDALDIVPFSATDDDA